ncbi:MAG: DUF4230 domain-containing protein [Acidimicrobiia bacterium]|nr:DUF4230 domain-containing protein [Acidimicrobiia bacterium]
MESRSRRSGFVAGLFLSAFLVVVGAVVAVRLLSFGGSETVDRSGPAVLQALENLSSYRAASGNFQIVVDLEEDAKLLPSFVKGERTLMVAAGSVDAAVDFGGLDEDAVSVDDERRTVRLTLPHATLTAASLDHERTYVASRNRGLLDRVDDALGSSPVDDSELYRHAARELETTAADTDLVAQAEENTRAMLTGLLGALGFEDVTVTFTDDPAA